MAEVEPSYPVMICCPSGLYVTAVTKAMLASTLGINSLSRNPVVASQSFAVPSAESVSTFLLSGLNLAEITVLVWPTGKTSFGGCAITKDTLENKAIKMANARIEL
jgi:hypothetical protein